MRDKLALSVRQPWAELILRGEKEVEYRSMPTKKRERVLIYASSSRAEAKSLNRLDIDLESLIFGAIVGSVEIVGCRAGDDGYEWLLANPRRFRQPIEVQTRPQPVFFRPFLSRNCG